MAERSIDTETADETGGPDARVTGGSTVRVSPWIDSAIG